MLALLMTGLTSKWKCVQAAYRYSNWDEESLKPAVHSPESLRYAMGKARFTYRNDKNDPDPMVQHMFDLSAPNAATQHQTQFLDALEFIDFQDISASQRISQLSRHRRLRRTINNLKVTMKNRAQWSDFYDSTGIIHLPSELNEDFHNIAMIVRKRDDVVTSTFYDSQSPLITTPYLRHIVWLIALLVMNSWTVADVEMAYDMMSARL